MYDTMKVRLSEILTHQHQIEIFIPSLHLALFFYLQY